MCWLLPYNNQPQVHICPLPPESPPLPTPSHPSRVSQSTKMSSLCPYGTFSLAIYFTNDSVFMSMQLSQCVPPFPFPLCVQSPFSMSASLLLPCKLGHQYYFSRFHIYALIYEICFSLSDLLMLYKHEALGSCISSRFIHLTRTDSKTFLFMAE